MTKPQIAWHQMLAELGPDGQRRAPVKVTRRHFNPRPAGVIRPDSASSTVLEFLKANSGRFYRREQIVEATGRTKQSVDWALIYLRSQGLISAFHDAARNPRYLRYSIAINSTSGSIASK